MSILKKISILFIISLALMSIIGFWMDNINSKRIDNLIKQKYTKVANELLRDIENPKKTHRTVLKYNLKRVKKHQKDMEDILYHKNHTFGYITISKESFEDEFIISIKYLDEELHLQTQDEQNINDKMILNSLIFIDILVLVLIFLYILKLLAPLKKITNQITSFANGNLKSRIDIKSNDEIGTLAQSFNKMASTLEELIKTREELLRDIGHELRTPIAKGKFAIEKIDDFSQKELLKRIFIDLETLTNELIELEKLNSTPLDVTVFSAETLILESLDKLYLEDESKINVSIKEDFKISADLHYLCIAVKNIIDNALKYSTHFPIQIEVNNHEISVSNKGLELTKELDYYLKPFTQELSQRDGFGLGLSIVNKIIDKHHFILSYTYKNGTNSFKINIA